MTWTTIAKSDEFGATVVQPSPSPTTDKFPTYLLTPYPNDSEKGFEKAILFPEAPGRSVCMDLPRWRLARRGYDTGKIYRDVPQCGRGFTESQLIIATVVAMIIGAGGYAIIEGSKRN